MSGGGKSGTQTTVAELPGWAKPYAVQNLQRASNLSNDPGQVYSGDRYAGLNQNQTDAIGMQADLARNGTQAGNAGTANITDVLSGKYLNADSNPYLKSQIDAAQQDVVRNFNDTTMPSFMRSMVNSGSFGNSGLSYMTGRAANDMAGQLGNISTQMRGNAYNTERGNQMQALGMAPAYANLEFGNANQLFNAGQLQQQDTQNQYNTAMQLFNEQQNLPIQRLGILQNALGMGSNGQSQTTSGTSPAANRTTGMLGGAATGAGIGSAMAAGASQGSTLGPYGALIGGIIGAGAGYYGSR